MPLLPSAARGTMAVLRPAAYHLSPAVGLAVGAGGAHLLSNLYSVRDELGGGSASATLTRELFHRTHPQEPLRPTANKSLPAAHLSPSLCAAVAALAWERPGSAAVNTALRATTCSATGLLLPALAKQTGVSVARFERLVEAVVDADTEDYPAPLPGHTGTALLLRLLWLRATSRAELWDYLHALHTHTGHGALAASATGGGVAAAVAFIAKKGSRSCAPRTPFGRVSTLQPYPSLCATQRG